MTRIAIAELPAEPLAAAKLFHEDWLIRVETVLANGEDVMVVLEAADFTHRAWRRAIAAGLARAHSPRRVNLVAGAGEALDCIEQYLAAAPGVTGQYLESDAQGAGNPATLIR